TQSKSLMPSPRDVMFETDTRRGHTPGRFSGCVRNSKMRCGVALMSMVLVIFFMRGAQARRAPRRRSREARHFAMVAHARSPLCGRRPHDSDRFGPHGDAVGEH